MILDSDKMAGELICACSFSIVGHGQLVEVVLLFQRFRQENP